MAHYKRSRPRGMASWTPQLKSQQLLDQVNAVLHEYQEHLPLTCRQIFYRLVGTYGYPKREQDYKTLLDKINRARRRRARTSEPRSP